MYNVTFRHTLVIEIDSLVASVYEDVCARKHTYIDSTLVMILNYAKYAIYIIIVIETIKHTFRA